MTTLYANVADLRAVLQGTDDGSGTAAKLTDAQLTFALASASARISVYFGTIMDSSTPQAEPPEIFNSLALDLAAFFAYRTYLKNKGMSNTHPVYLAYKDAQQMLEDTRDGKIRLDPVAAGGVGQEVGVIINRIPPVFSPNDSNTRIDPVTGYLESDAPFDQWTPHTDGGGLGAGPVYQG